MAPTASFQCGYINQNEAGRCPLAKPIRDSDLASRKIAEQDSSFGPSAAIATMDPKRGRLARRSGASSTNCIATMRREASPTSQTTYFRGWTFAPAATLKPR